ncbi:hypothetical protein [Siphonobacter curvatus]|uniref:Uncharacterized protein n=1 Tax=Siphonobacter curvatus TaxID=2094562 RepID=A0A2S7IQ46_9BACT|nr:hypothetical protein [Siphonobacter curvatus]PQA59831.1 hypothetical protein C5O19_09475 [Siphonobacter curvatus]
MSIENKTPLCFYLHHNGDWAYFFINEWPDANHHRNGFTLTINSNYGCWGSGWSHPGESWKSFLTKSNDPYLMGNFERKVFQSDLFEQRVIKDIKRHVKDGTVPAKLGKLAIKEVEDSCRNYDGKQVVHQLYRESEHFVKVYPDGEAFSLGDDHTPMLRGFFNYLWPHFIKHVKELEADKSLLSPEENSSKSTDSTLVKLEKIKAYSEEELGDWSGVQPDHLPGSLYALGVVLQMVEEAIACQKLA